MRRSPRGTSSSDCGSLHKHDLFSYNAPDDHHGRRRSSGADDRLLLPTSQNRISRPSWTWSGAGGDVSAADAGGPAEGDTRAAGAEVSGDGAAGAGHTGGEAAGAAVAVEREWGKEKGKKRKNTNKWVPQKSLQNNPNEIYLSSVLPRQH
jgi:hypothetical protein